MPQLDNQRMAAAEATIKLLEAALAELASSSISPGNADAVRGRRPNLAAVLDREMLRITAHEFAVPSMAGQERRADG